MPGQPIVASGLLIGLGDLASEARAAVYASAPKVLRRNSRMSLINVFASLRKGSVGIWETGNAVIGRRRSRHDGFEAL